MSNHNLITDDFPLELGVFANRAVAKLKLVSCLEQKLGHLYSQYIAILQ